MISLPVEGLSSGRREVAKEEEEEEKEEEEGEEEEGAISRSVTPS